MGYCRISGNPFGEEENFPIPVIKSEEGGGFIVGFLEEIEALMMERSEGMRLYMKVNEG